MILAALIFGIYVIRTCIQKIKDRKRNGIVVPMILKPSSQFNNKYWNPEIVTTKNMCVCIIGLWADQLPRVWRGMLLVDYIGSERSQRPFGPAAATRSILNLVTCPHLCHHQQLTKKSLHSSNSPP